MKRTIVLSALSMWCATSFAQVEQDDMYFNKKDRTKLIQQASVAEPAVDEALARGEKPLRFDYAINKNSTPSETVNLAARDINPEYIARSQSQMLTGEETPYFKENYEYATQKNLVAYSDSLTNWQNSSLYSSNYFAPSISGWNSPYYAPYNDPFLMGYSSNPWCNPGFQSGLSVSFSYMMGNNWNYGWGSPSVSLMFMYGSPWINMNLYWGNFGYGYGNPYGGYYPAYYGNGDSRGPVYGKRGSRSTDINNPNRYTTGNTTRPVNTANTSGTGRSTASRTTSRSTTEYYTPQWKRVTQQSNAASTTQKRISSATSELFQNRSGSTQQRSSGSFSPSQRSSGSFSSPSRSSSGGSGGSRSSRSRGN